MIDYVFNESGFQAYKYAFSSGIKHTGTNSLFKFVCIDSDFCRFSIEQEEFILFATTRHDLHSSSDSIPNEIKVEWCYQNYLTIKDPNRSHLDSIFHAELNAAAGFPVGIVKSDAVPVSMVAQYFGAS